MFAQQQNFPSTHFSECIPIVKWHMTVLIKSVVISFSSTLLQALIYVFKNMRAERTLRLSKTSILVLVSIWCLMNTTTTTENELFKLVSKSQKNKMRLQVNDSHTLAFSARPNVISTYFSQISVIDVNLFVIALIVSYTPDKILK